MPITAQKLREIVTQSRENKIATWKIHGLGDIYKQVGEEARNLKSRCCVWVPNYISISLLEEHFIDCTFEEVVSEYEDDGRNIWINWD